MKTFAINPSVIKKFPKKSLQGKICLSPFVSVEVNIDGDVRLCGCSGWMPFTVGNIFKETIDQILSNVHSQDIRRTIADGTYEYCNEINCGVLQHGALNNVEHLSPVIQELVKNPNQYIMPHEISIAGDSTCNLSCPSCRKSVIKNNEQNQTRNIELGNILRANLFSIPTNNTIRLHVSTSGEIFASPLLLSFINSIVVDDFPNLELCIQTNGLLMERNWHRLGVMQDRVSKITITTDAACASTYEKLRRGGNWNDLQKSLAWISEKKKNTNMLLHLRMIIQHDNYNEITEFYQQADALGADVIEYSRLSDWKTYSSDEFAHHDIFSQQHPLYDQAQSRLNDIKHLPKVFLYGGLS
jgi:MoaA/NifB/PqqE/SkfB family radical SAM enzyme